jgi:hypothetical protein
MTEPADKNELIVYENVDTAPFVYFDLSPTHGILGGAIQIELAARILNAVPTVALKSNSSRPADCDAVRRPR